MANAEARIPEALDGWGCQAALAFEEAAAALDLESWIVERLRYPAEESTAYLQLVRDTGDAICIPLFQVQHSAICGPTIGSLSMLPDLQLRDCEAVAMERSWQAALLGLPFGGASYGLVCDPAEFSERELMQLLGLAGRQLRKARAAGSLLFPGRGCDRQFTAKLFAEMRNSHDLKVTGKPDCLGGVHFDQFAAEGVAAIVSSALLTAGKPPNAAKVAIQGLGPLGQAVSQRLASDGLAVVALSDSSGAIYRLDGLILEDIRTQLAREHVLFGYSEAGSISRADLLHLPADVRVLTSGANEIHAHNWNGICAQLVVEADWNAVSSLSRKRMAAAGVLVIPWLLAASGALLGSYFEGRDLQILSPPEKLLRKTRGLVEQLVVRLLRYAASGQCFFEEATRRLAIEQAAGQARTCGIGY